MSTSGLNNADLDLFERQLAARKGPEDLVAAKNMVSPHSHALNGFVCCLHPESRARWAACLDQLIAMRAPLQNSNYCAAAIFASCQWGADSNLFRQYGQKYMDAGYMAVDRPLAGALSEIMDTPAVIAGKLPLAAAIGYHNPDAVRFLLDNGASMDIGKLFAGGEAREALEYAEEKSPECAAVIVDLLMTQRVRATALASGQAQELGSTPSSMTSRGRRSSL